jgi:hypothetical protein
VRSINKLEVLEQTVKQEGTMPRQKTREEWLDRIDELEAENETLQDQVDSIADIIERRKKTTRLSNSASLRCGLA